MNVDELINKQYPSDIKELSNFDTLGFIDIPMYSIKYIQAIDYLMIEKNKLLYKLGEEEKRLRSYYKYDYIDDVLKSTEIKDRIKDDTNDLRNEIVDVDRKLLIVNEILKEIRQLVWIAKQQSEFIKLREV